LTSRVKAEKSYAISLKMFRLSTLIGKTIRSSPFSDISYKYIRNFSLAPRKFISSRHTAVSQPFQQKSFTQQSRPYPNDLHILSHSSDYHYNKSGQNQSLFRGALLGLGFVIASCAKKDDDVEDVVQSKIIGILNQKPF